LRARQAVSRSSVASSSRRKRRPLDSGKTQIDAGTGVGGRGGAIGLGGATGGGVTTTVPVLPAGTR